ncbi:succinate dehydrogenase, hydrophobic membrane anchor protein [Brevundimonas sp. UBA7534]|uniref:succinate dehydrogenase, hydrophobic membrane anchor protein n=1 Tax=Brevundimonas sp. UBA7534 TaxID=1946138 RepID=UPI0025BC3F37|nr:succinate dehydrogenase, hydrophobic membrane anchor protein [Brevundimonas sp. UBA7534]
MSSPAKFRNRVKISERHGAGEWTIEKLLLAALMPLSLWVASSAVTLAGADYGVVAAWFANGLNATLAVLAAVAFCGFAALAWKVIVEDYIHRPGNKALLLAVVNIACFLLAAASVFFIVRLALGSAPLPAGV